MKPKVLKSVRVKEEGERKGDYVELLKDGEVYIERHQYSSMYEPREYKTNDYEHAHLHFLQQAMFILSD